MFIQNSIKLSYSCMDSIDKVIIFKTQYTSRLQRTTFCDRYAYRVDFLYLILFKFQGWECTMHLLVSRQNILWVQRREDFNIFCKQFGLHQRISLEVSYLSFCYIKWLLVAFKLFIFECKV